MPWTLPDTDAERLALANGYPYAAPLNSYLFRDSRTHDISSADYTGRVPVLAHGSNRAPEQLARKFARFTGAASEIPVTYVWLDGYDVVYSAHITRYGSIASTLRAAPGCRVKVALTWLNRPQLERMHETEGNYRFGHLDGVGVTSEEGPPLGRNRIALYLSEHGCLADDAQPVGLAAIASEGRGHPTRTQGEALEFARRCLAPELPLESFILGSIADEGLRRTRVARLREIASIPETAPHFRQD